MDWPNVVRVPGRQRVEFLRAVRKLLPVGPVCVELGVLRGDWAVELNRELRPSRLVLVDPWRVDVSKCYKEVAFGGYKQGEMPTAYSTDRHLRWTRGKLAREIEAGVVEIVRKFSFEAVSDFADGTFDFVYVDACHLYEDVKRDLEDWEPKLKRGGLLCGHDYKVFADHGVIEAVDEFCVGRGLEVCLLAKEGDFAVVVR